MGTVVTASYFRWVFIDRDPVGLVSNFHCWLLGGLPREWWLRPCVVVGLAVLLVQVQHLDLGESNLVEFVYSRLLVEVLYAMHYVVVLPRRWCYIRAAVDLLEVYAQ